MTQQPAGWFPDPQEPMRQRWWDGTQWTEHITPSASGAASPVSHKSSHTGLFIAIGAGALVLVIGLVIVAAMLISNAGKEPTPSTDDVAVPMTTAPLELPPADSPPERLTDISIPSLAGAGWELPSDWVTREDATTGAVIGYSAEWFDMTEFLIAEVELYPDFPLEEISALGSFSSAAPAEVLPDQLLAYHTRVTGQMPPVSVIMTSSLKGFQDGVGVPVTVAEQVTFQTQRGYSAKWALMEVEYPGLTVISHMVHLVSGNEYITLSCSAPEPATTCNALADMVAAVSFGQ